MDMSILDLCRRSTLMPFLTSVLEDECLFGYHFIILRHSNFSDIISVPMKRWEIFIRSETSMHFCLINRCRSHFSYLSVTRCYIAYAIVCIIRGARPFFHLTTDAFKDNAFEIAPLIRRSIYANDKWHRIADNDLATPVRYDDEVETCF